MGKVEISKLVFYILTFGIIIYYAFLRYKEQIDVFTSVAVNSKYSDYYLWKPIDNNTGYADINCVDNIIYSLEQGDYKYEISIDLDYIDIKAADSNNKKLRVLYNLITRKLYFVSEDYNNSSKLTKLIGE